MFAELKRRNIFRVAGVYAVVGWITMQVISVMTPALHLPDVVDSVVAILLIAGFPVALIFAWAFEMTPGGVQATTNIASTESIAPKTGRKLNFFLTGALAIALGFMGWKNLRPANLELPQSAQTESGTTKPEDIIAPVDAAKQSIAVLPFEDFSEDKTQDYFARGISEELLNVLARIDGLRVASRTSAFAFKDQNKSVAEIANELNVAHVLEGSVRKSGDTVRITAQLIDTSNDEHLWSETYDRPLTAETLFSIQDEIAEEIVTALKGELTVKPPEASGRTLSLQAYELYLKARENQIKRLPEPLDAAMRDFQRVIDIDPNFAPAYSGLAETHLLMYNYSGLDLEEAVRRATPIVTRALELAPNSAEALATAAMTERLKFEYGFGDLFKAESFARAAIRANSNYPVAYLRLQTILESMGRISEALTALETARKLDPSSAVLLTNIAKGYIDLKQYGAAKSIGEDLLRLHPDSPFGYDVLSRIARSKAKYPEAHRYAQEGYARNPEFNIRFRIVDNYIDTGLYDRVAFYVDIPNYQFYVSWLKGNKTSAQKILKNNPSLDIYADYLIGDNEVALSKINAQLERRGSLDSPIENDFIATRVALKVFFLRQLGQTSEEDLARVEAYLAKMPLADVNDSEGLKLRAMFAAIKADETGLYRALDRMIDLGVATPMLIEPVFDPFQDTPEFQRRFTQMEVIRTKNRELILAQLASPEPNWVLPK